MDGTKNTIIKKLNIEWEPRNRWNKKVKWKTNRKQHKEGKNLNEKKKTTTWEINRIEEMYFFKKEEDNSEKERKKVSK